MRPAPALLSAAAVLLLAAGCGGGSKATSALAVSPFRGSTVVDSVAAPELALHDQAGRLVTMSGQRGRFALVTFLYTNCPDVCPLLAEHLNTVLRRARTGTSVLAVSVDPKGDTAAAVRGFAAAHHLLPQFRYLRGNAAQLRPVWAAYHVAADPGHGTTAVGHSAFVLLVDRQGKERLIYPANVRAADIVHDLRALR